MCVSFSPGRCVFSSFGLWLGWRCSDFSQVDAVGGGEGTLEWAGLPGETRGGLVHCGG